MPLNDQAGRRAAEAFLRLLDLAARLRAPDGCPWDREQTVASSTPYILEEAYEAVDALEARDWAESREELGDLLFQVVFQAQIGAEKGRFDAAEVIETVEAKMIRRHPHVFGEAKADTAEDVLRRWSEIKRGEKDASAGLLDSVPRATAALTRAQALGKKAARVGFDWPDGSAVIEKVAEECAEIAAAPDQDSMADELGDLLFALAQWARHQKINAEAALRRACSRFQGRFEAMEQMARQAGTEPAGLGAQRWDELWNRAKAMENPGTTDGTKRNCE